MTDGRTLPDYEEPPVVETAFGVEFESVRGWSIPHFGLYWALIKDEYPTVSVQAPLGTSGMEFKFGGEVLEVAQFPVRCWFIDKDDSRLVQLQHDRLIQNWRKTAPDKRYPRYESVRTALEREWQRFSKFLNENGFSTPCVKECEVTYVNHLERGKGWNNFGELAVAIAPWSGQLSGAFLPSPSLVSIDVRFPVGADGQLRATAQPGVRNSDAKEIIQLTLTAKIKPLQPTFEHAMRALDLGRSWVVQGFTDITTPAMHKLWRRIQ